jgi:hypothetical protein
MHEEKTAQRFIELRSQGWPCARLMSPVQDWQGWPGGFNVATRGFGKEKVKFVALLSHQLPTGRKLEPDFGPVWVRS